MRKNNNKEEIKFLADKMLGKLTKWLRILGYDTTYPISDEDITLILTARRENRILLTRDTNLIKRKNICDYLFIKSDQWEEQLLEVIRGLKLIIDFNLNMFSRCSLCNTPTIKIDKRKVEGLVPPYVFLTQKEFFYCPSCQKYYWKGTHWQRMKEKIEKLIPKNT